MSETLEAVRPGPISPTLLAMGNPDSFERLILEATLGPRSFRQFFRMAWKHMDPAFLLWNWHIDLICDEMERVARREITEAVFCIPPRSLKSQILSVAFPAWVWTWFPSAKFITGSNEMTLATRDATTCRRLIESEWYQARWGPGSPYVLSTRLSDGKPHTGVKLRTDQNNKTYYETIAGGHRFCCTPGSNVTGHGGDFVLCDDPHPTQKAEGEAERLKVLRWWNEAIPTRLNEPDRGVKIVIQQRVHRDDLAGNVIEKGYYKVVLPMEYDPKHPDKHPRDRRRKRGELLHPQRIGPEALKKLKTALGPYGTAGQLQQRPAPREGGLLQRAWFKIVDVIPAEARARRVRRWDLAASLPEPGKDPDWTVGVLMCLDSQGGYWIENVIRFRADPADTETMIRNIATQDGASTAIVIPQDPGGAGKAQAQRLVRFLSPYPATAVLETDPKNVRANGLASQAKMGNVFLLRGAWNEDFLTEMGDFPTGAHDDQVDAAAGAINALAQGNLGMLDWMRSQAS